MGVSDIGEFSRKERAIFLTALQHTLILMVAVEDKNNKKKAQRLEPRSVRALTQSLLK